MLSVFYTIQSQPITPNPAMSSFFGLTSKPYTWVVAFYKAEIYSGFGVIQFWLKQTINKLGG